MTVPDRRPSRSELGPATRALRQGHGLALGQHAHPHLAGEPLRLRRGPQGRLRDHEGDPGRHGGRPDEPGHGPAGPGGSAQPLQRDPLREAVPAPALAAGGGLHLPGLPALHRRARTGLAAPLRLHREDRPGAQAERVRSSRRSRPRPARWSRRQTSRWTSSSTSSARRSRATRTRTGAGRPTISASASCPTTPIIHLEDLDASWAQIGELTSTPDLQEEFFCRNSTGARKRMQDYFTPDLLERVAEVYARDYAELGYSHPSV